MKKSTASKSVDYFGMGAIWAIGLIFGLVLFGVLYAWYLSGYSDTTSVMTTAILLIIIIFAVWYVVMIFTKKKYAEAYQKAIWFGIGLFVAILVAGFILAYLGLTAGVSVSTLVYAIRKCDFDSRTLKRQVWIE